MRDQLNDQSALAYALVAALPAELHAHATDLAVFLGDLAAGLAPADAVRRLAEHPMLALALTALAGQTIDIVGRRLHIAGDVGNMQQITISGGYVERIVGAAITIQLPPAPRIIDPVAAQELIGALPLSTIPALMPLPPGSHMPLVRNPLFVGRAEDLRWLARTLKAGGTVAIGQVAAATGLGGIGKTNLATEWVYRYGQFFAGGVFWLSFADRVGVFDEIAACGGTQALGLYTDADGLSQEEQVARVLRVWQEPIPRLIVLDTCDDADLLAEWRPRIGGGCRVLLTSRSSEWDSALGVAVRRLGVLARDESIALLQSLRADLSDRDAGEIARVLGDLPLALHLAGSFLRTYPQEQAASYLARLDSALLKHPSLVGRGVSHSATDHDLHMARTFALSYDRLNVDDPIDAAAHRLLAQAACLAPNEPIPSELLLADHEDETARLDAQDALGRLVSLSLLDREQDNTLLQHRLLHAFVCEVADDQEAQSAIERVLISKAQQFNETGYPNAMRPIAAHLRYATERAKEREDERAVSLCHNLAYYLEKIGDYSAARPLYERALAIREAGLGPNHSDIAGSLNNLAGLHHAMGDYSVACPLYERALAIREISLGSTHPDTATSLNNLAGLHHTMGDYNAARSLYERAIAIREASLGSAHPDTATSLNNLAGLHYAMGDYSTARPLYERALAIRETNLGPSHPQTATSLSNLAELFRAVSDYSAARPLDERALAIREISLGLDHPDTATSLSNLAINYYYQSQLEIAAELLQRALDIRQQRLGPKHPDTLSSRQNLEIIKKKVAEQRIAQVKRQTEDLVARAIAKGTSSQRAALLKQLEEVSAQIERKHDGASSVLAAHIHALAEHLRQAE